MSKLLAGFGRVNVTPMLGIGLRGYFQVRKADGVLDEMEANAVAFTCGDETAVFVAVDLCAMPESLATAIRKRVTEVTGLDGACVHVSATHSHTAPYADPELTDPLVVEYTDMLVKKTADAIRIALDDRKEAKIGWAVGNAPNIAFIRRFRMKDGSIRTNPGVNNPDILAPLGDVDERVNVLRIDQKCGKSIVYVNFGDHPDTVGGCKISADWPGFTRRMVEKALDNTRCVFFNGAQGDVNHVNVWPKPGDSNDMVRDFDDVDRGYGHARHMGNVVAGAVLQVYDKVAWFDETSIRSATKIVRIPSNRPTPEELPEAHRINDLHNAGRDNELPYEGMMLTTVVADAARKVMLENGPDYFDVPVSAIAIGNVAMVTIPGEPFTEIGRELKKAEGWDMVMPMCLTDAGAGYYPVMQAYVEGGYEACSSRFKAGVAELLIEEGKQLLASLR